jgi:alkylmercury lyase
MRAPTLDEVAGAIAGAFPKLSPDEQRISIAIYRCLAQGRPARIGDIARQAQIAASLVETAIRPWYGIYYDDSGAVAGYWGLTLSKTRHRLSANGHDLYAWCAWDTLFIPMLLGSEAEVESECPVSGERISLRVTRDGAEPAAGASPVVSFVTPRQGAIEQDVIRNFCHFVVFFASAAQGEQWIAAHPGTFLLPLADAWELGRRKNAAQYRDTLDPAWA